jgi:hypothetical protein
MKRILSFIVLVLFAIILTGCKKEAKAIVSIGYKDHGGAGEYNASMSEFLIGENMYFSVKTQVFTDKKKEKDFTVKIYVPKVDSVEIVNRGGIEEDSIEDSDPTQKIITYTIQGKKEDPEEYMFEFKAIPVAEDEAKIKVKVFDEDGEEIKSYYSIIYFEY